MIRLTENYSIDKTDDLNWTVFVHGVCGEKSKTPGKETCKALSYHADIEHAVAQVLRNIADGRGHETVGAYLDDIKKTFQVISFAIKNGGTQ
jgi:hypothetical protein